MSNPYVNKVETADGSTIIDITDTTAVADDVAAGKYFYSASGARTLGTASEPDYILTYDENSSVGTAQVGTATTGTPNYTPSGDILCTKETINSVTSADFDLGYSATFKTLTFYGITLTSNAVDVVTGTTFSGNGVKFTIEKEETE